jgi:hypothetical protein
MHLQIAVARKGWAGVKMFNNFITKQNKVKVRGENVTNYLYYFSVVI